MNTFSSSNDRWWEDHIEAFVDGTLNPDENTRFESLIKRDPTAAREVELAGSIQKALRSLSSTECPDYVTKTIIRNVRVGIFDHARRTFAESISGYFGTLLRPAITMAVFLVIVLASVWSGPSTNRPVEPVVAEALEDVKWTLAYLSKITKQTGSAVRTEAIEPLVIDNMQDAIGVFIDN